MKVYSPPVALSALSSFCHQCHRSFLRYCWYNSISKACACTHVFVCMQGMKIVLTGCVRAAVVGNLRPTLLWHDRLHLFLNAPFNCSLGVYAQGGGEPSLRHTNTHQRFISVSTWGVSDTHVMLFVRACGWAVHCDPAPWHWGNPSQ